MFLWPLPRLVQREYANPKRCCVKCRVLSPWRHRHQGRPHSSILVFHSVIHHINRSPTANRAHVWRRPQSEETLSSLQLTDCGSAAHLRLPDNWFIPVRKTISKVKGVFTWQRSSWPLKFPLWKRIFWNVTRKMCPETTFWTWSSMSKIWYRRWRRRRKGKKVTKKRTLDHCQENRPFWGHD